tara:strand:- start:159 stop:647 length:489 start_codon:yes stop_codon:yes gene_type:complete
MSSLYNKNNILYTFLVSVILIVIQGVFPKIYISEDLVVSFDIFLIYLTILVFTYELHHVILIAFFIGLFQDFIINKELIGLASFAKSITIYMLGFIKKSKFLWNVNFKYFILVLIYFSHFIIFYFPYSSNMLLVFKVSVIYSIVSVLIFSLLKAIFYNKDLM